MNNTKFILTETDKNALILGDSDYINNKGAKLYCNEDYKDAVEYYRLAAAMGNITAISNLGYCYFYGRDIEANLPLALSYFRIAALNRNADAAYKLGDIYSSEKWDVKDKEMSVYYYRMATSYIIGSEWEHEYTVAHCTNLQKYPSLCYALGRELSPGGDMATDIRLAYHFLKHAEAGYKTALNNGQKMYKSSYNGVLELLSSSQFDDIKKAFDNIPEPIV